MSKEKAIVSLFAVLVLCSAIARGGPASHVRLYDLVEQSNVVIVGKLEHIFPSASGALISISVIRVLKGSVVPGDRVTASWELAGSSPIPSTAPSVIGLWFLRNLSGKYQILPLMNGNVPFPATYLAVQIDSPNGAFSYDASADPFDKVLRETGAALESGTRNLQAELILATGSLGAADPQQEKWLYARLAQAPAPRLQALGLQGLIRSGDVGALKLLSNSSGVLSEIASKPLLASSICEFRNTDSTAISVLRDIVNGSGPAELRRCAAYALRSLHTRESLPMLADLLDADSSDLRYEGIAGLAAFANNLPVHIRANALTMMHIASHDPGSYTTEETRKHFPTIEVFQQEETRYINFWKAWWIKHRNELGF